MLMKQLNEKFINASTLKSLGFESKAELCELMEKKHIINLQHGAKSNIKRGFHRTA